MRPAAIDITRESRRLDHLAPRIARGALVVGVVFLALAALLGLGSPDARGRFFSAYLTSYAFFLSLTLGALFFVLLHHLARAGWSVVVRRLAETLSENLPLLAVLFLPILLGMHVLYRWMDPGAVAHHLLSGGKQRYLNGTFFIARFVVYFAIWIVVSRYFATRSLAQDRTGDVDLTRRMERRSAPAMVVYSLAVTFAAFDLVMSLDPSWYSTIFPVYFWDGGVVGFFALLPILTILLQRSGRLQGAITHEHYHDMGKLIFAFVIFWAYIAFSQYMLMWYGNLPEETGWFLRRQTGGWTAFGLLLLFGHFFVPFLVLLPRMTKRRRKLLILPALWVLAMHWVDVYWLVMPEAARGQGTPGIRLVDLCCFLGLGGLYVAAAAYRLRDRSLVPEKDPRLQESLAFESI